NDIEDAFKAQGYVVYGNIDEKAINTLKDIDKQLGIPDFVGCDFNVGMNSDIYESRKLMQERIAAILMPFFENILVDFDFFSASFVNKNPTERFVITAHQDFTYSDEPNEPSFMCWIPLINTNYENGAIGFIPKSHLFYNYKRAFPFPLEYSPIVLNEIELMKYLDIQQMKAGQMVFFFNNTIHGSFANYSKNIRQAINISFIKKNANMFIYITDPNSVEKKLLKYKADKNFLIKYNNPYIQEMYKNKDIKILDYQFVGKEYFGEYQTSWVSIHKKLKEHNIQIQQQNIRYLNRFVRVLKKEKIKDSVYSLLKNILPILRK
ncbi:MAG: phytanoyl-CoA dioxygenase family protein, partial [Chitinophagaceae bacterium]|nr:phytanoyl-CoA dioxygenase family protein [Chitinophagaceae bacterium]